MSRSASPPRRQQQPKPSSAAAVVRRLEALGDPEHARVVARFFQTHPGGYAHGDQFLGLRAPQVRAVAREFRALPVEEIAALLESPWHEARLLAVVIMAERYSREDSAGRAAIFKLYTRSTDRINNWDLVDVSAPHVVGAHLQTRSRSLLTRFARSKSVWARRIAILSTLWFIRDGEYEETLRIATLLLHDPHDLIHKAVGWMLREVGNRDRAVERAFLDRYAAEMPRTMLRYAIEKFPEAERKRYLGVAISRAAAPRRGSARSQR